jgi:hypothetical protein
VRKESSNVEAKKSLDSLRAAKENEVGAAFQPSLRKGAPPHEIRRANLVRHRFGRKTKCQAGERGRSQSIFLSVTETICASATRL